MNSLRQLFVGLVTAISSSLLVLAAISLAIAEGGLAPTPTLPGTDATVTVAIPLPGETLQATQPPAVTVPPVEPTPCLPPDGWTRYTVQSGDTLEALAAQAKLSTAEFSKANCLRSASLPVGSDVYMPAVQTTTTPTETPPPPLPTIAVTNTPFVCLPPPAGWIIHIVQPGETLYRLGQAYGLTAGYLQEVNCLPSIYIQAGQRLYVPNVPTRTPIFKATATATPRPTDTSAPTETETPAITATNTATETPILTTPTQVTITPTATIPPAGGSAGGTTTPGAVKSTVQPTSQTVTPPATAGVPAATQPAGTPSPAGTLPASQ